MPNKYTQLINDGSHHIDYTCQLCLTDCQPDNALQLPKCQHIFHLKCLLIHNLQNPSICPNCSKSYNKMLLSGKNNILSRVLIKNHSEDYRIGFSHYINNQRKGYSFMISILCATLPLVVRVNITETNFNSYALRVGNKTYINIPKREDLKKFINYEEIYDYYLFELNPQIGENSIERLVTKAVDSKKLTLVGKIILKNGLKESEFPDYDEINTVVKLLPSRNVKSISGNFLLNKKLLD